ncbi:hypothetical protein MMC08_002739, partial [Hypocenomyce scalaris]|nr:hypothetical protein [Hypocenomyce scalaris]
MTSYMTHACARCYHRKSRCDKISPTCSHCKNAGVLCVYNDRFKQPTYRRDFVERLEKRLRNAEAKNSALSERLTLLQNSALQAAPPSPNLSGAAGEGQNEVLDSDRQSPASNLLQAGQASEANDTMSDVSEQEAGERQFLGSCSGLLLADLVRETVGTSDPENRILLQEDSVGDSIRDSIRTSIRDLSVNRPISQTHREALPPVRLAKDLVSAYFSHDHISYPFLHRASILRAVDLIYSETSFYTENHFEAFAFDMILAIATANVSKFDTRALPGAQTHQKRALLRLTKVLGAGGIKSLQALLLLCQYRMGSPVQDTSA